MFIVYRKHATRREPVEILAIRASYDEALKILATARFDAGEPTMPTSHERRRSHFDFDCAGFHFVA